MLDIYTPYIYIFEIIVVSRNTIQITQFSKQKRILLVNPCLILCLSISSQLQRNILATCPRVTRFKIDWGSGDEVGSENVPPSTSTENESNQMAVDQQKGGVGTKEETMDAPLHSKLDSSGNLPLAGATSSSSNGGGASFNGLLGCAATTTDSNGGLDIGQGQALAVGGGGGEPMQL